jgi:hypothetical protein
LDRTTVFQSLNDSIAESHNLFPSSLDTPSVSP